MPRWKGSNIPKWSPINSDRVKLTLTLKSTIKLSETDIETLKNPSKSSWESSYNDGGLEQDQFMAKLLKNAPLKGIKHPKMIPKESWLSYINSKTELKRCKNSQKKSSNDDGWSKQSRFKAKFLKNATLKGIKHPKMIPHTILIESN